MAFDLENFAATSERVQWEDLDFDAFDAQPLDDPTLRVLRYMCDVEYHTSCYLRDLLVTRSHRKDEARGFMTTWNREEFWHGEALGRVLEAHGEPPSSVRVQSTRDHQSKHDAFMPMYNWVANKLTPHVPAVHMTWGAINEWLTQAAYTRLAAKADHPVFTELLSRIKKQEGRHIDFYASQARRRLEGSTTAQRMTRFGLRNFWTPVGAGLMPEAEVRHLASLLFSDDAGRAAVERIDRQVDRLPGLAGLGVAATAADRLVNGQPAKNDSDWSAIKERVRARIVAREPSTPRPGATPVSSVARPAVTHRTASSVAA